MNIRRTYNGIGLAALAIATVAVAGVVLRFTPVGETMATFADREAAIGTFSTSRLNMQGNATSDVTLDSTGWSDHTTDGNAAVFQPALGTVIPGSIRSYSRFGIRLADSTVDAMVTMAAGSEDSSSSPANLFRMRLVHSASETCDASSFAGGATFLVGSAGDTPENYGTMLTPPGSQFTLKMSGAPVHLCYEFSLPASPPEQLTNGATATVRWTITAESAAS